MFDGEPAKPAAAPAPAPASPTGDFERKARPTLTYVVCAILVVHYVIGPLGQALWHWTYTHLTELELGIIVAPAVYYIFQRTYEKKQGLAT